MGYCPRRSNKLKPSNAIRPTRSPSGLKDAELDVPVLLHKEVGGASQRIVRILDQSRRRILWRIHQILRLMIGVEVAIHRMARQIAVSVLAVSRIATL